MKIKIYRKRAGENLWRFRVVARNGKIVASGEGYHRFASVVKTLKLMFGENSAIQMYRQIEEMEIQHYAEQSL